MTKIIVLLIVTFAFFALYMLRKPPERPAVPAEPKETEAQASQPRPVDGLVKAADARPAPQLADGTWINSKPLKVDDLRGRVVLIEFWTFGCYNCVNTLPAMKRLHKEYADKGLTLVGIETPELQFERVPDNLVDAVKKRGIEYPVLTDYEEKNWNAFKVEAWPTIFIVDKAGRIRYSHIGEGAYDDQEEVVKTLLAEAG